MSTTAEVYTTDRTVEPETGRLRSGTLRDAVRKAPLKARSHVNLGYAYYFAGDFDNAIPEFRRALALDRDDPVAQANLLAVWKLKETEQ